jgi:hypothetical protein
MAPSVWYNFLCFFIFIFNFTILFVIFLSTVFIDIDHYIFYIYKTKNFSLKNSYEWYSKRKVYYFNLPIYKRRKLKKEVFLFHGLEFWALIILLSAFYNLFLYVFIGLLFHMILDYIELIRHKELFYYKFSQIINYIDNKDKKEF